jgi:hypothetical protein
MRLLLVVAVLDRRGVLVPVRVQGVVLGVHAGESLVEDAEHIAHVGPYSRADHTVSVGCRPTVGSASTSRHDSVLARFAGATRSEGNAAASNRQSGHRRSEQIEWSTHDGDDGVPSHRA